MTSIKLKCIPSDRQLGEGMIYYFLTHKRVERRIKLVRCINLKEWDEQRARFRVGRINDTDTDCLRLLNRQIEWEMGALQHIVAYLEAENGNYTVDDVKKLFLERRAMSSFFYLMERQMKRLKQLNRERCYETYRSTYYSLKRFCKHNDLMLYELTEELLADYEAWLKNEGLTLNTISFYMRIVRAVYNVAVREGLIEPRQLFRRVYTGIGKTVKRAISLAKIKQIKHLKIAPEYTSLLFARDMFLFSFYLRGISFVDMAFLKKSDLKNGVLIYCRHKTGQQLCVKWEKCMQEIVDRYPSDPASPYLLPIIKQGAATERSQYKNGLTKINKQLKMLGRMVGINDGFTMYVARHSWANAARCHNVPISVISEGLGHDSESTTHIYLASLTYAVDNANRILLKKL